MLGLYCLVMYRMRLVWSIVFLNIIANLSYEENLVN